MHIITADSEIRGYEGEGKNRCDLGIVHKESIRKKLKQEAGPKNKAKDRLISRQEESKL